MNPSVQIVLDVTRFPFRSRLGTALMSSRLTVVTSDSPAVLMDRMAAELGAAPLPPLETEMIVVNNYGMRRWVTQELAWHHGCAASLELIFPGAFCRRLAEQLAGEKQALDPRFERDALVWRILDLFERGVTDHPDFASLQRFGDGADTRKRLGLAVRAADCLDDYQLYRPDVLAEWEADPVAEDESSQTRWQHALWRELCDGDESPRTLARWFDRAFRDLEGCAEAPPGLPSRVTVFGINSLPPHFLRLLKAIARFVPVHMYVLAPPRTTWTGDAAANPLFRAFGHTVREMMALLGDDVTVVEHATATSARATCLDQLRDDVRHGRARGREAGMDAQIPIDPDDASLSVHVCHSAMREMEVLRDQIFAAFAADPTLRPHDVLILVPDTVTYAPLVEAVFDIGEPELPRIPHRVADRPIVQESSLASALVRLLQLAGARWTVPEIAELLDIAAIRRAAGITDRGAQSILRWVEETRIRWGRDGAMRKEYFALPPIDANTWRDGLNRLLMGYAVGPTDDVVGGVLPHAGDTVGDPHTLGAFAHWLDRLFELLDRWRTPRALSAWRVELRDAALALLRPEGDDEERAHAALLKAIDMLDDCETYGGCHRAIDLTVVRDWIERSLESEAMTGGFLTGGMVVAAFKPMRAIPFRVIAIAGLDDGSFPRTQRRAGYDLLEIKPREGDHDRRANDRQLFLDTIFSATDRLILTYVGRSARDNTERAPSVVVAELLDIADDSFTHGDARARDAIVTEHRLQPFSPEYYGGHPRLFSFSRVNARATAVLSGERTGVAPFVPEPLPHDAASVGALEIRLNDLIDCWTNPSKFFCKRVLELQLPSEDEEGALDCEPMFVDGLCRYGLDADIVRRHLAGDRSPERERMRATLLGDLPPGKLAGLWFDQIDAELASFLELIQKPSFLEPATTEVKGATWRLTARVDQLTAMGRFEARPAKRKPKDLIRAWITHLVVCTARDSAETTVVARDSITTFPHVPNPIDLLDELVTGYRAALRAPLPVFEGASWEYARKRTTGEQNDETEQAARRAARLAFRGSDFGEWQRGDSKDAHVDLCWRGRDPFEDAFDDFSSHSSTLWAPVLAAKQERKPGASA